MVTKAATKKTSSKNYESR